MENCPENSPLIRNAAAAANGNVKSSVNSMHSSASTAPSSLKGAALRTPPLNLRRSTVSPAKRRLSSPFPAKMHAAKSGVKVAAIGSRLKSPVSHPFLGAAGEENLSASIATQSTAKYSSPAVSAMRSAAPTKPAVVAASALKSNQRTSNAQKLGRRVTFPGLSPAGSPAMSPVSRDQPLESASVASAAVSFEKCAAFDAELLPEDACLADNLLEDKIIQLELLEGQLNKETRELLG